VVANNEIVVVGQDALRRTARDLLAMAERARDTSPAWRAWGEDVLHAFREQFETEGLRLTGRAWSPLSPRYAAWKARHFPGQPILQRTGAMFAQVSHRPMEVERVTASSGEYGLRGDVPRYHQHGTRKMPARPIARVTQDLTVAAARRVRDHILHGMTR